MDRRLNDLGLSHLSAQPEALAAALQQKRKALSDKMQRDSAKHQARKAMHKAFAPHRK
jgi:hypothetical protein